MQGASLLPVPLPTTTFSGFCALSREGGLDLVDVRVSWSWWWILSP